MTKELKEDIKEIVLVFGLGALFLIAFNKFMYLIWNFIVWVGVNVL